MAKAKKKKSISQKSKLVSKAARPRKLKQPTYKSFKRSKAVKHPVKLPSAYILFKRTLTTLKTNWKLFLIISLIYGGLTIILVHGFSGVLNLTQLKATLKSGLSGNYSSLTTSATLFGYLLGSAGSSASASGGVYQTFLIIVSSLVIIWALRQVIAGQKIKVRDAFYKGTYPLVPFILVLIVIGLQLLPLTIGAWLYSVAVNNAIAVTSLEKLIWAILAIMLAILSLYMICSSLFALYIVTLPDMTPLKALRSARQLVLYRRWTVLRKILYLPIILLITGAVIMIPLILLVTAASVWIFFILSMFTLVIVHSYMYTLYRQLLWKN